MAGFKIRCKVEEIGETQTVGNNGFQKREVIGQIEGEWPDFYKFEFIKDKTSLPDELIPGTYVTFHFNMNGKKVDSKNKDGQPMYFTTLQCWKVDIG